MKIKTLAEILAESETDSANLPVSKRKSFSHKKLSSNRNADFKQKTDSNGRTDENQSITETKEKYQASDLSRSYDNNDISNTSFQSHDSEKISKKSYQKIKKRKKQFHPAASFTAEPTNIPAYQPPEFQNIKQMLAEVKYDIHEIICIHQI